MIAFLLAVVTAVPLPSSWNGWKYERAISTTSAGPASFVVPPSLFANARPALDDLRIVRPDGNAVPFAIVTPQPSSPRWRDARLSDEGFVRARYSQIAGDLGPSPQPYATLEILTPEASFATSVDVDASDDRTVWRSIRTNAPIYDYQRDGLATNTVVTLPETTARYIRVRVMQTSRPFSVSGLRVSGNVAKPPERTRYTVHPAQPQNDTQNKKTLLELNGISDVPIDRIQVDATTGAYVRPVGVEIDAGNGWQSLTQTTLRHVGDGRDRNTIEFPEQQARRWRLSISNGDDAPLAGLRVLAFGAPRRVQFDAEQGEKYTLVYGNSSSGAPSYDYAQTHEHILGSAHPASLADPLRNPTFSPVVTTPWTERNPWLLWGALGIAVIAIGWLSIRSLGASER